MLQPVSKIKEKNQNHKNIINLALGGTFDHFHKGHRYFLNQAFQISKNVVIGITNDAFAKKIHENTVLQSFKVRKKSISDYLNEKSLLKSAEFVKLQDHFGPTADDESIEALLVTKNTLARGHQVNNIRKKNGLLPLALIECELLNSEDGKIISSRRIRDGKISREGVHYFSRLMNTVPLSIPSKLRQEFRKPFGKIFKADTLNIFPAMRQVKMFIQKKGLKPVICVGDVVTHSFLKVGGTPKIKIIDFMVQRKKRYSTIEELGPIGHLEKFSVSNQPGSITKKLVELINASLNKKSPTVIQVKGEEDLAVLPSVLLAPLGTVVLYGHFQHGIISVEVTESKKEAALQLLRKISK